MTHVLKSLSPESILVYVVVVDWTPMVVTEHIGG